MNEGATVATRRKKRARGRRSGAGPARDRAKKTAASVSSEAPVPGTAAASAAPSPAAIVDGAAGGVDLDARAAEPTFAARVTPPAPERPLAAGRRAIFFDVENTSRAQHIAHVIDHLALDRSGRRTDFVAVGNWKVIGLDTARVLARHGAFLVHSAPAVGVRDWSDLRIAVTAGVWLAAARPGDIVEIVSDDRAFDAVGDVAASLGIEFRRLSYRGLGGAPAPEVERPEPASEPRARSRRRGRRRGWQPTMAAPAPGAPVVARAPERAPVPDAEPLPPHTAPHDEIVAVVRDLMHASPRRSVTLDTLANTLKARGFSQPPGSPRLITRLRRIKEVAVSRSGTITLVDGRGGHEIDAPSTDRPPEDLDAGRIALAVEPVGRDEEGQPQPAERREHAPSRSRRRSRRGRRRRAPGGGGADIA
jgi:hypothetical protein